MKKDAYWFSHDSNAKDDPKCVMLIEQLGLEGYGIFWILIEILREQPTYKYPLSLLPALARRFNTTHEKVKAVVMTYNLFQIENKEFFFSDSLLERMIALEGKREKARLAGIESGKVRKQQLLNGYSTTVERPLNEIELREESKVKESKEDIHDNETKEVIKDIYGEMKNVYLTKHEHDTLITDYGIDIINNYIDRLSLYDKINKYKDHNRTLRAWMLKDGVKKETKPKYLLPQEILDQIECPESQRRKP